MAELADYNERIAVMVTEAMRETGTRNPVSLANWLAPRHDADVLSAQTWRRIYGWCLDNAQTITESGL